MSSRSSSATDGVKVTQATLSRDLDELGAVKVRDSEGALVYAVPGEGGDRTAHAAVQQAAAVERLRRRCEDVLVSVDSSANMVVLRTPPGAAQFLASAIDHTVLPAVIGTVAGDDTIFMVTRDPVGGAVVAQQLLDLVGGSAPALQCTRRNPVKERVVLAYSGGLDTSVGIGWIAEATGAEVIAVAADVGQGGEDLDVIRQRALDCGAVEAEVADARDEFAEGYCLPALKANALYMDRYPLVSALSRPVIVKHLVAAARKHGASVVAHGCTGKGNDQVRFEVGIGALAPDLSCLAPVRDLALTRDKAIDYAEQHSLPIETTKKNPFSIDQNVWGRAVETGFLEDIWNAPTEEVYSYTSDPSVPREADEVVITFDRGVPVALDGRKVSMLEAIVELNARAGAQGVGRIDLVEDRLVGIKSREVYEAPGAMALIAAHAELENVTVERDLAQVQAAVRAAVGRAGLRRSVVQPAQARAGPLLRRGQRVGLGRRTAHAARRAGHGLRSAQRPVALRLQPRDLRRGRQLRPVDGQGLRRAVGPPVQDRGQARPRPGHRWLTSPPGSGAGGSPPVRPRHWPRCPCRCTSTGGWRRTTWRRRRRTPACCTGPVCSTTPSSQPCWGRWTP